MGQEQRRKVIVTGGAGYIGSHTVVELHAAGFAPLIVDNFSNSEPSVLDGIRELTSDEVPCYRVDCNDRDAFGAVFEAESPICGVIHFAANKAVGESVAKPLKYYRNNIGSLVTLLELLLEHNVPQLVFSSSCTVYGQPDSLPVTENSPVLPAESPYGATKQICESLIADVLAAGHPLKSMILRYFNPIGAHPSSVIGELPIGAPENLVPYITQTAAGLRDRLTLFGNDYATVDGSCVRDYIHVVDLAKAHVAAMDWLGVQSSKSLGETLNLGSGQGTSVLEAIAAFERVSGAKLNYVVGSRRPGDVEQIYAEVTKSKRLLGWETELDIDDGMRDSWNWQLALAKRSKRTV
jgi:UDP-glucose 4-epimerase